MSETRSIVAEFHKDSGGRLSLWQVTVIEDKGEYFSRTIYDVEVSRKYGYLFHESGRGGGSAPIEVEGIYFASGDVRIKEKPCQLVDGHDKSLWRGKRTRAIRKRNRTRRLRELPKQFSKNAADGGDLLNWLEQNSINEDSVYCSICRDHLPSTSLCDHCWWCDTKGWYSTPAEGCACKTFNEMQCCEMN